MLILFNKIKLEKQIVKEIRTNQQNKLKRHAFAKWMYRFKYLTEMCNTFTEKREKTARSEIFYLWKFKYMMVASFKGRMQEFTGNQKMRMQKKIFAILVTFASEKTQSKRLTQISSYVFIKKHLTKCFGALRTHAKSSKVKKQGLRLYEQKQMRQPFEALKVRAAQASKLKKKTALREAKVKALVFKTMKQKYLWVKEVNRVYNGIMHNSELRLLANAMHGLRNIRYYLESGIMDEYDKIRAKFLFRHLKQAVKVKKAERERAE